MIRHSALQEAGSPARPCMTIGSFTELSVPQRCWNCRSVPLSRVRFRRQKRTKYQIIQEVIGGAGSGNRTRAFSLGSIKENASNPLKVLAFLVFDGAASEVLAEVYHHDAFAFLVETASMASAIS
jgi:hypothetical protein